jgi:hypothetical protein
MMLDTGDGIRQDERLGQKRVTPAPPATRLHFSLDDPCENLKAAFRFGLWGGWFSLTWMWFVRRSFLAVAIGSFPSGPK